MSMVDYVKDNLHRRIMCIVVRTEQVIWFEEIRPGGEGGNGPPEGKFTKLGGKVNFGVLSLKLNVIRAKKGGIRLFLTNKTRSHAKSFVFRFNEYECWYTNEKWLYLLHLMYLAHPRLKDPKSTL